MNIQGEAAPLLWHGYRRGSLDALKRLVEYNRCDIEGMKYILDKVVARLLKEGGSPSASVTGVPRFAKCFGTD